jgi:two-component system chemotaxis response regulator CheB
MNHAAASRESASSGSGDLIRVLVVDDSSVIRGIVSRWIEASPDMQLCGSAVNGKDALQRVATIKPDIILLDIEMPEMDGITALPLLLKACPQTKIIMASTLTRRNAEISLKALALGASDYVPKPTSMRGGDASDEFKRELFTRIIALGRKRKPAAPVARATPASDAPVGPNAAPRPVVRPLRPNAAPVAGDEGSSAGRNVIPLRKATAVLPAQIVAIGSSTGGPQALITVISALAPQINVPIVITQHMPPTFTSILAETITRTSGLKCVEGVNGMMLEKRQVYVAPGGYHMTIKGKGGPIELNQDPPENFCRPAVDPMFRSLAAAYGGAVLGVILTGMGSDGREGSRSLTAAGGIVLAQDEESSVVWGMPGAVAQAGLASAVLPLNNVGPEILKQLGLRPR